jgi:hypothetical protein
MNMRSVISELFCSNSQIYKFIFSWENLLKSGVDDIGSRPSYLLLERRLNQLGGKHIKCKVARTPVILPLRTNSTSPMVIRHRGSFAYIFTDCKKEKGL